MSRRAMLAPMRPRPITPICMASSSRAMFSARPHRYSLCFRHAPAQDKSMTPSDLAYTSAADLARMIGAKRISALEVVQAALERAEKVQAACNCFITLCGERALADAAAADQALA